MKALKNAVVCVTLVCSALTGFSDGSEAEGGIVLKKGSYLGRIAVVNSQQRVPEADICAAVANFAESTRFNVAVVKKAENAAVVLTIVDDPKEPSVLVAPEDHWGRLNVAKLVDDLPAERAKKKFLAPRTRKMILKTLSLLCGGASSTFKGNLMNTASMRELDVLDEQIPMDMFDKYTNYLRQIGVTPKETATYFEACMEGWAPQPTNDVQKALWKEIHDPPSNPIKIKFDPAKAPAK